MEIINVKVSLNGAFVCDPETVISGGEILTWDGSGIIEPEVDDGIFLLYEDQWFVAINKTGNLHIHPVGRYFNNTLVAMLEKCYGRKVFPVHRLYRET
jgi:23S rRNA pseudouridine955/2504/2580 synthase